MAIMVDTYKPTATTTNSNYNRILVYKFLVFYLDYYYSFVYWLTVCKPECFVFGTNKVLSIYLSIKDPEFEPSGSYREGCIIPTYFIENESGDRVRKKSDIDYMWNLGSRVGFESEIGTGIDLYIDTSDPHRPPGYLQLRQIQTGNVMRMPVKDIMEEFHELMGCESLQQVSHGPALTYIMADDLEMEIDSVKYHSFLSWPAVAECWYKRKRPSNWPPDGVVREIVSKGCRVVHAAHPTCGDKEPEYRFSFSSAEIVLFDSLSLEQKHCFVAFKALIKYTIHTIESTTKQKSDISTYHLKNLFMWTCEIIPADDGRVGEVSSVLDRSTVLLFRRENNAWLLRWRSRPVEHSQHSASIAETYRNVENWSFTMYRSLPRFNGMLWFIFFKNITWNKNASSSRCQDTGQSRLVETTVIIPTTSIQNHR